MEQCSAFSRNPYNNRPGCNMNNRPSCNMNNRPGCNMNNRPTCNMNDRPGCNMNEQNNMQPFPIINQPLAMAYVPVQHWKEMYPPAKALIEGTAFPDLNYIFCGIRG